MAFNKDALLKLSTADFFVGPVGTALPTDVSSDTALTTAGFKNAGYSSIEDILSWETEGGERTTLGAIQAASLRESVSASIRSFIVNFLQWDTETLKLFYGANAVVQANGIVSVPETSEPTEVAVFARLQDGRNTGGFYAARASVLGEGDISISDSDSLSQLPVRFTPMIHGNSKSAFDVLPIGFAEADDEPNTGNG